MNGKLIALVIVALMVWIAVRREGFSDGQQAPFSAPHYRVQNYSVDAPLPGDLYSTDEVTATAPAFSMHYDPAYSHYFPAGIMAAGGSGGGSSGGSTNNPANNPADLPPIGADSAGKRVSLQHDAKAISDDALGKIAASYAANYNSSDANTVSEQSLGLLSRVTGAVSSAVSSAVGAAAKQSSTQPTESRTASVIRPTTADIQTLAAMPTTGRTDTATLGGFPERPDNRCGPRFGGAICGPGRCCNQRGYCGFSAANCMPGQNIGYNGTSITK